MKFDIDQVTFGSWHLARENEKSWLIVIQSTFDCVYCCSLAVTLSRLTIFHGSTCQADDPNCAEKCASCNQSDKITSVFFRFY